MKSRSATRWGALLLALVLCVSLAGPVLADNAVEYTADTGYSRAEIGRHYAAALAVGESYVDGDASSYYTVPASTTAPYAAGTLTPDTQAAMTAMTDYYRWLVGVAPLKAPSTGSDALQKGALVRNWDFNHEVDSANKPEDMDESLWDAGARVWHNIIADGYSPRGAICGYLNEGYSLSSGEWDTIGHRMALLSGDVSALQYGYSGLVQIGVITERNNTMQQPFAAFPAAGNMPLNDVSARASAWSVELNPEILTASSSAIVTVTNLSTGESYTCTSANGKLHAGQTLSFVQPAPASGGAYAEGEIYQVVISGLTDAASGASASIRYTVRFFDVRNYMSTTVTNCTPIGYSSMQIPHEMNNAESLAMLAEVLPKTVAVETAIGRTLTLPVSGAWKVDAANSCWTNSVDSSKLPAEVTDPDGLLAAVRLPWSEISYTGRLTATNAPGPAGVSGNITLTRCNISYTHAELYQRTQQADGSAQLALRFDNSSSNYSEDERNNYFAMDPWQTADSGLWIAVYYSDKPYWTDAYAVGGLTVNITCAHSATHTETKRATCTEAGSERVICDACGETVSERTISALGHDWGKWVVTTQPTEDAEGVETHACSRCGETENRSVDKLPHTHRPEAVARVEADCTHTGTEGYWKCEKCGKLFSDAQCTKEIASPVVIPALGHSWGKWVVTTRPTEDAEGVETRTCARCDKAETRSVPKLSHIHHPSAVAHVDATCTKAGMEAYWKCDCGRMFRDEQCTQEIDAPIIIAALGHSWGDWVVTTPATVDAEGVETCTCARCGATETRAVEKLTPPAPTNPFVDVIAGKYYYKAVLWAVNHDPQITKGKDDTHFEPNAPCTRGEVVTFLWRAMGKPAPKATSCDFTDVNPKSFYYKAVLWAVENNITKGTSDTTFGPNDPCTRGHVVTFLYRAKKAQPVNVENTFTDLNPKGFYYKAVLWAVANGITQGATKTTFEPNTVCTRGQIVTFLQRADKV